MIKQTDIGREISGEDGAYELRESDISYNAIFANENADLRSKNTYFRDISTRFSITRLGPPPESTDVWRPARRLKEESLEYILKMLRQ